MASLQPQVRSGVVKGLIEAMDALDPTLGQRVRAALPRDALEQVEATTRLDWTSALLYAQLCDNVLAVLGHARARALWNQISLRSLESGPVKLIFDGVIKVFGLSPRQFVRVLKRGIETAHRNMGGVEVEDAGPNQLSLRFHGVPGEVLQSPGWQARVESYLESILLVTRRQGTVATTELAPERGRFAVTLTWRE
jgi:hypothetical protein